MHTHHGEPIVVDGDHFYELCKLFRDAEEQIIATTIVEGCRDYDLDFGHLTLVQDISGREIGRAQVVFAAHTTIQYLSHRKKHYLHASGYEGAEFLKRSLLFTYPLKKDITKDTTWVTVVEYYATNYFFWDEASARQEADEK